MNGALGRSDVWDLAAFQNIRIKKRAVYASGYIDGGKHERTTYHYVGHLKKGLSTRQAWIEITESYSK